MKRFDVRFTELNQKFDVKFTESDQSFNVRFAESDQAFDIRFAETDQNFDAGFSNFVLVEHNTACEPYLGDYSITPKVSDQKVPVKNKMMVKDLTVEKIPYFEVSNTSGGVTATIGSEV